jgi:hypothetical protein
MRLVNAYHKRVSLADKDLDLIHNQWLNVGSFHLDYGQQVVVDGELKIWLAGNGNEAESVPTAHVISSQLITGRVKLTFSPVGH